MNCRNCGAVNDVFATTCIECGAFLQNPIKTLDLFQTLGLIIIAPARAFRRIAIAEHKNYSFAIQIPLGIAYVFLGMAVRRGGMYHQTLLDVLLHIGIVGVATGIVLAFMGTLIFYASAKLFGSPIDYRDAFGLFAYSLVPLLGLTIVLLPVELLTFGMYLFTSNPPPRALNPESWYALRASELLFILWAILLLYRAGGVGLRLSRLWTVAAVSLALTLYGALVLWVAMNVPLIM